MTQVREPVVAGQFYPASPAELRSQIARLLEKERKKMNAVPPEGSIIGGVVPHAGYMFSGYHAVHFFEQVKKSNQPVETVVIVNPSHTGLGPAVALDENDEWESPLGIVSIDREFSDLLPFPRDSRAHDHEHSGEVMLPFLQYFLPGPFRIVPVSFRDQKYSEAKEIATAVHAAAAKLDRKILFIASSDFCHYMPAEQGFELDELVVPHILKLDAPKVELEVRSHRLTICGFGPIMALIEYALLVSPEAKVDILRRGHSGEVMPSSSVVDYISILFCC